MISLIITLAMMMVFINVVAVIIYVGVFLVTTIMLMFSYAKKQIEKRK